MLCVLENGLLFGRADSDPHLWTVCGVVWEPQLSAMTFLVSEHAVAEIVFIQARFLKTFFKRKEFKIHPFECH